MFVWDANIKDGYSKTYGFNISGESNKLNAVRLLKEFLYEEIGQDENGNPIRNFHQIYDYQSILELKKWAALGNFDRVSEMLLRGIEWKALKIKALKELANRRPLDESNIDRHDILDRDWF